MAILMERPHRTGWANSLTCIAMVAIASLAHVHLSFAQTTTEYHRTLTVTSAEAVKLDIDIPDAELKILYRQEGQVTITALAQAANAGKLDDNLFPATLSVEQNGNHVVIRQGRNAAHPDQEIKMFYRIDVPYRTEVISRLKRGNQNISGIMGPVKAVTEKGDITASYISTALQAEVGIGNLDLQVIEDHVEAKTGSGNISCARLAKGVAAETGDGDISLVVIGPSTAIVKKGTGRIDVGGARGGFVGSTDGGDIHIRAIPHEDWDLSSGSGSVRLEVPAQAKFALDASTKSGEFQIDREDIPRPTPDAHRLQQSWNGGGNQVRVHTESGKIAIR